MACNHLPECVADCIESTVQTVVDELVPQLVDVDGNPHDETQDGIVEGIVDAKTGVPTPTDGTGRHLVTYLPGIDNNQYPLGCDIATQRPVWCDTGGSLWTERPFVSRGEVASTDPLPFAIPHALIEGARYRGVGMTLTNDDPCGRVIRCCVTFSWSGWAADFTAGASGILQYVASTSGGAAGLIGVTQTGEVNSAGGRQFFDGFETQDCFDLIPGSSRSLAMGYVFTQETGAGSPLPTLFSTSGIYRSRIVTECESV